MSKEAEDGGGTAQRGESINNGSELMLNNTSTADREHSQNPPRAESMAISNDRKGNKQETEIGGDSLLVKTEHEKHSESFNLRRRSSSQSLRSKEILAATPL